MSQQNNAEKEAKREAENARRQAHRAACTFLAALGTDAEIVKKLAQVHADIPAALKALAKPRTESKRKPGRLQTLAEMFLKTPVISELDLFKALKAGDGEMVVFARKLIADMEPDKRLYIWHNVEAETWELKGTGPVPPADWKGYRLPRDKQ